MRINVYELAPDGSLINFAEGVVDGEKFRLGSKTAGYVDVPFLPTRDGLLPVHEDGRLYAAQLMFNPGGLGGRESAQDAVLKISTFALDFALEESTRFPRLRNVWVGAEPLRPAFKQVGDRRTVDQHQILGVKDGTVIFVADRKQCYVRVTCHEGQLTVQPAIPCELGMYIILRARILVDQDAATYAALMWTWHSLRALSCADMWPADLQTALAQCGERPRARA